MGKTIRLKREKILSKGVIKEVEADDLLETLEKRKKEKAEKPKRKDKAK